PRAARHASDLLAVRVEWNRHPRDRGGDDRREILRGEHRLDAVPVDLQPDEAAWRAARLLLLLEGALAREAPFGEVDEPSESEFEGGVLLLGDDRVSRARVVGLDQDEPRFEPRHVEGLD